MRRKIPKVLFCYDIIHWHWFRLHIKFMTYVETKKNNNKKCIAVNDIQPDTNLLLL